ncbi:MAG: HAD hydrolase-like protein [Halodesulfurarchaeum sp.]|nr:HAD hydrolase-like protein [Halodesulfurarchaeum sp.]
MHVAFDMDGVLLDSESDLSWLDRALEETLRRFDVEPTDSNRKLLYPTNLRDFDTAAETLGVPPEELWPVRHEAYVREKRAAIQSGEIAPFSDINELHSIAEFASLSIISNSPESIVETFVAEAGLEDAIDHRIGRGPERAAVETMKPARTFFDRLNAMTDASEYVYVGDNSSDALFAQRTGMTFVHLDREKGAVTSLFEARERIEELL